MQIALLLALALISVAGVMRFAGVDLRADRGAVGEGGEGGEGGDGASGDDGGEGAGSGDEGGDGGAGADGDTAAKAGEKLELTQAELDDLVAKRVAKATKAAKAEADAAAEKAKLDETERTKLEAKEAEEKAAARERAADLKLIRADAKTYALVAGADPKQVDAVVRLADLDDIDVDETSGPDEKAVKSAIDKVLKTTPALKAAAGNGNGASGGEHNGGNPPDKPKDLADAVNRKLAGAGAN